MEQASWTPKQIVAELNKYIVGQGEAKKSVAIALRNRWRRKRLSEAMQDEIIPKNILLIGPTGVGKTEIARRLAKLVGAPFIKVEATKYTEVGYVGRDVEQMIRDLVANAIRMVQEQESQRYEEKAEAEANKRILQVFWPKKSVAEKVKNPMDVFFGSDDDEAKEEPKQLEEGNSDRRQKMLEDICAHKMDEREIEVEVAEQSPGFQGILTGNSTEELTNNFQEMLGSIMPKKKKKKKMTVAKAREIFKEEELEKCLDMDTIVDKAVAATEESGIVFIDEFDKIAEKGRTNGPDVSREGVQRDILPIVEGATVNTKYGPVKTDHILFIAAGAFHVSKPSDLIPELQGRFPIRVELQSLTVEDFRRILTEPSQSLVKQYTALLETEGLTLEFTDDGINAIAEYAYRVNRETENIGARRLHTILEKILEDVAYEAPDIDEKHIVINQEFVAGKLHDVVQNVDLSHYIL
ncbi:MULTISPECIES: ATP-dependent protease ATPase subunit HslU [Megasphaera]|uniref:ATP-dependent protease ATPase subunit HslU n=1 Tax=Megasphaera TaxID=906 RepID=UPI001DCDFB20|nr:MULTISPECIES: ATP-dependent protease ATPase subunit HslU [Megasphaera]MBS6789274.1 ATP-dependent protease ATPase subunit HslU [Megasphaera sp.]MCQ5209374.1 ATP-dependent protease ATPase subunit HslU [Megasphaera massiliensis]MEE0658881.1 ATP-dependent protease ATPase subunit HslU [Megasphaera massiliensis]